MVITAVQEDANRATLNLADVIANHRVQGDPNGAKVKLAEVIDIHRSTRGSELSNT